MGRALSRLSGRFTMSTMAKSDAIPVEDQSLSLRQVIDSTPALILTVVCAVPILANAQAAKRWLNAAPSSVKEAASSIERIIRDARAADETMQHIRALFKQESFDKKDVNIPDILRGVVRFVQEDPRKRDVPIECRFEESLSLVPVDEIQIQQVFINLIVNAIEALEEQQVAPLVVLRALTDSNGMLIQVIDNGPGVDDPDRIFDAFMTTKEKGMGIGLAVSRSIV